MAVPPKLPKAPICADCPLVDKKGMTEIPQGSLLPPLSASCKDGVANAREAFARDPPLLLYAKALLRVVSMPRLDESPVALLSPGGPAWGGGPARGSPARGV